MTVALFLAGCVYFVGIVFAALFFGGAKERQ